MNSTRLSSKPAQPKPVRPNAGRSLVNMGVYVFTTETLVVPEGTLVVAP